MLTMTLMMATLHGVGQKATVHDRQEALALEQQGKNSEAETAWRAYLKTHPLNPEPYAHIGLIEARQEHYKGAVLFYRKAMALNPALPSLRLNLGLALFKSDELKQAIQEFQTLLKSEPSSSPEAERLTILIGMAYYGLCEYAEAVPYLKEAAASDSQNLPLRLALAHSCLWAKQYQCVLDTDRQILTLNAESAEADMLAGEALDELQDYPGAIQQFRAAVKADPKEFNVHFGLGYLLWTQRQFPEAASEFQAELGNNPNHLQALAYLADTQIRMNHPEVALPLLEKVEQIAPALPLAHLDLGVLYVDTGRNAEALRELNEAAKLAPDNVNVNWRLAQLYRSMGKKTEAEAEFDKTRRLKS